MSSSWNILSKYRDELYGFSIIWIILFHGIILKNLSLSSNLDFLTKCIRGGNCGVEIFLLLSGIGLYYSFEKNNSILNFYIKRIKRILFSFIVVIGSYYFFFDIIKDKNVSKFLLDITLLSFWINGDKFVWFVALIVILYLIYPLIYKYVLNRRYTLIYIISLILGNYTLLFILRLYDIKTFHNIEIALTRIPVFLIGCYLGNLVLKQYRISTILKGLFVLIFFGGLVYFDNNTSKLVKYFRLPFLFIGPSIAIVICVFLEFINSNFINRFLAHVGKMSFELYLTHVALRLVCLKYNLFVYGNSTNYCIYILFVGLGSYIISNSIILIRDKLCNV